MGREQGSGHCGLERWALWLRWGAAGLPTLGWTGRPESSSQADWTLISFVADGWEQHAL